MGAVSHYVEHPTGVLCDAHACRKHNPTFKPSDRCSCKIVGRVSLTTSDEVRNAAIKAMRDTYEAGRYVVPVVRR